MQKIKAIIVDDEPSARENLSYLLQNFCSEIKVLTTCCNVEQGVKSINEHQPDVVFLDIEMPQKNGFSLLKEFPDINFQIIFVTAYDHYAIKAFEVSAFDYLLKPIDIDRLLEVAEKLKQQQEVATIRLKMELLLANQQKIHKISIPYKSDYVVFDVNELVCIKADRMYSCLYLLNGKEYTASKKLSYYEDLLIGHSNFLRVHRSWFINLSYLEQYSKANKEITLKNTMVLPVSKTYKEGLEIKLGVS